MRLMSGLLPFRPVYLDGVVTGGAIGNSMRKSTRLMMSLWLVNEGVPFVYCHGVVVAAFVCHAPVLAVLV